MVDDETSICDLVEDLLRKHLPDATVVKAFDGQQGLRLLEKARFDLVIADLKMPILDGVELTKQVAARWPAVPVIIMTGSEGYSDRAVLERLAARAFVRKPFNVLTLATVVQNVLEEAETAVLKPRKRRVLVVEDTEAIRRILAHLLTEAGYDVEEAQDGEEAVEALQARPPELAIVDVMIPGIDGFNLCRMIKQNADLRHIPVLVCSSRDQKADVMRAVSEGASDYIIKPFKREDVLARVRWALKNGPRP